MSAARLPGEHADATRALGFVNTLSARPTAAPVESLSSYDALVDWARAEKIVSAAVAARLLSAGRRHPHQAASTLARAVALREALYALCVALDLGRPPSAAVLDAVAGEVAASYAAGRLVLHERALQWVSSADEDLNRVVWEVARAAGRLVTSPQLAKVRVCAAPDCGWLFLDDTRNRSRRWCDMKICGNREKIRRYRARQA